MDLPDRLDLDLHRQAPDGRRPCFGGAELLADDPAWRDNLVFSEYFHGDNGAGLGASHQTGWTGLVADIIRRRHGAVPYRWVPRWPPFSSENRLVLMTLDGEYEPSPAQWVRDQVEEYEASGGQRATRYATPACPS